MSASVHAYREVAANPTLLRPLSASPTLSLAPLIDGLETLVAYNPAVSGPLLDFAQDVEERARRALTARSDLEVLDGTMTQMRAAIQRPLASQPA